MDFYGEDLSCLKHAGKMYNRTDEQCHVDRFCNLTDIRKISIPNVSHFIRRSGILNKKALKLVRLLFLM